MLIASFGNAVAADYAAFVSQSSQGDAVVVADEKIRRLVEAPVRSLSMDEFLRSTPDIGSEHGRVDSLILFINSRLTARERRELDEFLANRSPMADTDLSASSAPFGSISTILMSRRSRTTSSLERATCLLASSSFVPVMC